MEMLVTQTVGASNLSETGVLFNRAQFLTLIVFTFFAVFALFSESILLSLGYTDIQCNLTAKFLHYYIPGIFFAALNENYRKFLQQFHLNWIPLISITVAVIVHLIALYIFLIKFDMGIEGLAIAGIFSNAIDFIMIRILILFQT
jgi:Na+-driven multidrug efflux pump